MKKRTKRWLLLARNWGIFLGIVLGIWIIVKIARPNVNYALKDKYFHRRKLPELHEIVTTDYIEDLCNPDTEITFYDVAALQRGEAEGITYNDGLYILNDRYYIQGEDFLPLLETTSIDGYGDVTMVRGAAEALKKLLSAAEAETGEKFILGESYVKGADPAHDHGNDCYMLAYYEESEHVTGMGIDLLLADRDYRTYMKSPTAKWLQDNAWRFGFTVRYPFWEGEWTGVFFQPWHLKYVGQPHAAYMYLHRYSLEEYIAKTFSDKRWFFEDLDGEDGMTRTYVIFRQNAYDGKIYIPDTLHDVEVSFDNTYRYYYVTGIIAEKKTEIPEK
ncbi:MAG: D-alanyl-D-alanine carboxypeptidase family protein [Clostridia bacterium]|nr:D-alanyl-D-alanine carboxypeptidase family protein [Clostridia bacterium]